MNRDNKTEKTEQEIIKLENKYLSFILPIVGIILFLFGLLGFILIIGNKDAIMAVVDDNGDHIYTAAHVYSASVVLMILAVLGAGGIAFGVYKLITFQKNKLRKEETEPVRTLEQKD